MNDTFSFASSNIITGIMSRLMSAETRIDLAIELGLIATAGIVGYFISRRVLGAIQVDQDKQPGTMRTYFRQMLPVVVFPLFWLAFQWLLLLGASGLGRDHELLTITSSLLGAWVVIQIATSVAISSLWSTTIAWFAWSLAALNILGILSDVRLLLDSFALEIGQVRLSVLTIFEGLLTLTVLVWGSTLVLKIAEGYINSAKSLTPSLQVLSIKLLSIFLVSAALIITLAVIGVDLTALAIFGGAIGVGLGFGLQKIFSNLISGIILLLDKSIKPGDVIEIAGYYGRVDSLGARYASVHTRDGIEHLIPNEDFIVNRVENWSYSDNLLRLKRGVGIHYDSDVKKAMALCYEAAAETPRILKEPATTVLIVEFGDSSVNLEIRFWINDPMNGRAGVASDLYLRIWDKFHEHGIQIPFPQRDLHLKSSAIDFGAFQGVGDPKKE